MLPHNMVTPHSSPEKGFNPSSVVYPSVPLMYSQGADGPPRTLTPPCNIPRRRTPETLRAPANRFSNSASGNTGRGLGMKRKCASEGCLSSKCYIREISKGMDKMIIKVKTPPSSPDNFPVGWAIGIESDSTMQCFPHKFMKYKSKQGTSPPSSLCHLQSRDASHVPETNSPPTPKPALQGQFDGGCRKTVAPSTSNCSRTLWSVQEDIDNDENGFVMGMDYTASPSNARYPPDAYRQDEKFVPKRVVQLRGENGVRAGMFVRDAMFYKSNVRSGK